VSTTRAAWPPISPWTSVPGTFETCQPVLTMSGVRGRAEVAFWVVGAAFGAKRSFAGLRDLRGKANVPAGYPAF
jgi:hypothetical protein